MRCALFFINELLIGKRPVAEAPDDEHIAAESARNEPAPAPETPPTNGRQP